MELFKIVVENREGKRVWMDHNDPMCQYIYCPFEDLKYIATDTRRCIGDYKAFRVFREYTGRFVTNEELFGRLTDNENNN